METTEKTKVLYTGKTHTTGGRREGVAKSSDGILDLKLSPPGGNGKGTNPEQLFAAGWSACFEGAMDSAARNRHVKLPDETAIDAEVDLCLGSDGYFLQARLNITIPELDRGLARQIIEDAHETCPYSKAIRDNVNVEVNLL